MNLPPKINDGSYHEVLRSIQDPYFFRTPKWREVEYAASRDGVRTELLDFVRLLSNRCRELHIPVCPAIFWDSHTVEVQHGRLGFALPERGWEIIGHVASQITVHKPFKEILWGGYDEPKTPAVFRWTDI